MPKRALLVGIDSYDEAPELVCCVSDAIAMGELLSKNSDDSENYDCTVLTSDSSHITRPVLRKALRKHFDDFSGDLIFYFSGHGIATEVGGFLVTQDGVQYDQGIPMGELLRLTNNCKAQSVLLILDCCHSGELGNVDDGGSLATRAELRLGTTILAASRPTGEAQQGFEHSVFTALLLYALDGGAADIRGYVSAASMYGYVEQVLGPRDQRPMYKSHAARLNPIRCCRPAIEDETLRGLPTLFNTPDYELRLDPSFEHTSKNAKEENVAKFDMLKSLRNARLLHTEDGDDLYYVALRSKTVSLTPLGQLYWRLSEKI